MLGVSFGLSVCLSVPAVPLSVPDVTVLFSPVNGDREFLSDSDCEIVAQTLSLSRRREAFFAGSQEDIIFDGTPVKAPSASRRIIPPTPQQSLQPSFEGMPRQMEVEDQEFVAYEKEYVGEASVDSTGQNDYCKDGPVPERERQQESGN